MKATGILPLLVLTALFARGEAPAPSSQKSPQKSSFNAQIYEKDKSEQSFSALVKLIREVQDETEVFFEGQNGFYVLNTKSPGGGSQQTLLVNSQKKKLKVLVVVDPDSRRILSVSRSDE